jgi:hypothetical protein
MRDFRLTPRCKWDLFSSGLLLSVQWQILTDVLEQSIGPILTFEDGTYSLCQKSIRIYHCTLSNNPEEHRSQLKVKESHYRPGLAPRDPGGWDSQISRQSAHEGGKAVSPTHRPPLHPRNYSWHSFLLRAESTPGPQCGRKDYVNQTFQ